jgi:hypothetical protein
VKNDFKYWPATIHKTDIKDGGVDTRTLWGNRMSNHLTYSLPRCDIYECLITASTLGDADRSRVSMSSHNRMYFSSLFITSSYLFYSLG